MANRPSRRRQRVVAPVVAPGLVASWKRQPVALWILRAFLGVTFTYAGMQKFLDPNFLHPGTPDFIGQQLQAFSRGSPIAVVLTALGHQPVVGGIGVALLETAIGLATLMGIAPATAAAAGCGINVILFLSAGWHVHPYFLGSDSIYAVAWGAYLAGVLEARRRDPVASARRVRPSDRQEMTRRQVLRGAAVAAGSVVLAMFAGAAAGAPGIAPAPPPVREARRQRSRSSHASGAPSHPSASGTPVAKLSAIPVGGAVGFQAPSGEPAILVRTAAEQVVAYSRVCTHAGCLVGYDQSSETIVCPCHGAEFDPRRGASVIAGPAPTPLPAVNVVLDRASGEVLAPS
jgi:thiosulfate dehydrogenase [quinone] large subunit